MNTEFECVHCAKNFRRKYDLRLHIHTVHKILFEECTPANGKSRNICCALCSTPVYSIRKYPDHLLKRHNETCKRVRLQFSAEKDFRSWLDEEEKSNCCKFILHNRKVMKSAKSVVFICNRSGCYTPKQDRKRSPWLKGTKKIGYYCSAYVSFVAKEDCINVEYYSKHVGHDREVRFLPMTKQEESNILEQLEAGIPFSTILQSVRSNIGSNENFSRSDIISKRDLYNIAQKHRITPHYELLRHEDAVSIKDVSLEMAQGYVNTPTEYELAVNKAKHFLSLLETADRVSSEQLQMMNKDLDHMFSSLATDTSTKVFRDPVNTMELDFSTKLKPASNVSHEEEASVAEMCNIDMLLGNFISG